MKLRPLLAILAAGGALCLAAAAPQPAHSAATTIPGYSRFTMDPTAVDIKGMIAMGLKYMPVAIELTTHRPASVKFEPKYHGTPLYGHIRLGDGPNADTVIVLDEPTPDDSRIFVDIHHDGNLTEDGDGAWAKKTVDSQDGRIEYGVNSYILRASYGTAKKETVSVPYGIAMYHFGGDHRVLIYREAARVGSVNIGGKAYRAELVENDADGLYDKPLDDSDKPVGGGPDTRPVWLILDMSGTGKFGFATSINDIRGPFVFDHHNYEVSVTPDGSRVRVYPTSRAVIVPPTPQVQILADGTLAPNFTAENLDGSSVKLSDFKGKVIVLDMWATWCGPCNASMPHLEKVYNAVKDQGVVVLGLCVSDQRPFFQRWVSQNRDKYTFQFAYDPAGTTGNNNISSSLYGVSGIPTTFVIDKDGKIAAGIVGYDGDGDHRLEDALAKLGISASAKLASN